MLSFHCVTASESLKKMLKYLTILSRLFAGNRLEPPPPLQVNLVLPQVNLVLPQVSLAVPLVRPVLRQDCRKLPVLHRVKGNPVLRPEVHPHQALKDKYLSGLKWVS